MRVRKHLSRAALVFLSASMAWPAISAETSSIPDFTNVIWGRQWPFMEQPKSGPGPIIGRPRTGFGQPMIGNYTSPILKPEAADLLKKRGEISLSGAMIPDPVNQCWPEPTPFVVASQFGMKILQHKDEVTLLYTGNNEARHVRLNVPHPAHVTPSWRGDSVGHYEGDTLVIDTVGQKVGPLSMVDYYGTPFSPALHVIERYRLIDGEAARDAQRKFEAIFFSGGTSPIIGEYGRGLIDPDTTKKGLQVEIIVEDPGMFTTSWSGLVTFRRVGGRWPEAACAETHHLGATREAKMPQADRPDF